MATYPIKMLKDEENKPFVPLVSTDCIRDENNQTLQQILDKKLSPNNLLAGDYVNITTEGNNCYVNVDLPANLNIINNLTTNSAGQGALDAYQGKVLKDSIPQVVNDLSSTSTVNALSANQGYILNNKFNNYLSLVGGTINGRVKILGTAANQPLTVRGIVGCTAEGEVSELHLQYHANSPIKLGNDAAYSISADGSQYSGNAATATKATQDGNGNTISSTYLKLSGGSMTGTINYAGNAVVLNARHGNGNYDGCITYETSGNEAFLFTTKNSVTSMMFVNGEDIITNNASNRWMSLTPGLQIKENSVSIGELIGHDVHPTYKLNVNGAIRGSQGFTCDGTCKIYAERNNELNFGGTSDSTIQYFSYRAKDSKGIITQFIFGGSTGSANLKAAAYNTGSLRELKENIIDTSIDALDIIDNTNIVEFNFIADATKERRIGFIADDTNELLSGPSHDKMDLNNCVGVLFKAIQELNEENKILKAKIEKLEEE